MVGLLGFRHSTLVLNCDLLNKAWCRGLPSSLSASQCLFVEVMMEWGSWLIVSLLTSPPPLAISLSCLGVELLLSPRGQTFSSTPPFEPITRTRIIKLPSTNSLKHPPSTNLKHSLQTFSIIPVSVYFSLLPIGPHNAMLHPIPLHRVYYYPFGNTPPVHLTQTLAPEEDAKVLVLGCGDPRSIPYTIYSCSQGEKAVPYVSA